VRACRAGRGEGPSSGECEFAEVQEAYSLCALAVSVAPYFFEDDAVSTWMSRVQL